MIIINLEDTFLIGYNVHSNLYFSSYVVYFIRPRARPRRLFSKYIHFMSRLILRGWANCGYSITRPILIPV